MTAVASTLAVLAAAGAAAAPPGWRADADAVVAADGSGQFLSLQAAIAAAPTPHPGRRWTIQVRPGIYRERLYIQREKRFLRLVGEDPEKTVITAALHANVVGEDGRRIGTFATATVVVDADDFTAENLTFENAAGPVGQALAVRVDGDRARFLRCRFLGWQDTVFLNRGRQYFEGCFVTGHVDFIFGGATAFFERCSILALRNGYVTAASTPPEEPFGFVFSRCALRGAAPDVRTYLGRPWRSHASVVFQDTDMSEVVEATGWDNWDRPDRETTSRYSECGSTGAGARPEARVTWARGCREGGAARLTASEVLRGTDGWDPLRGKDAGGESQKVGDGDDAAPPCPPPARFTPGVLYSRSGPEALRLDVCVPPGRGPFPAALLVHGGGWMSGDRVHAARALVRPLTAAGLAWISIDYRLAPRHQYPAPVEDVEAAIRWTKRQAPRFRIDAARLALLGESAGGHLVAMAGARASEPTRVAAVVPLFAPVDLESDTERRGGLSVSLRALFDRTAVDEGTRQILHDASPINHVRSGLPPFLLVHGTADMSVSYEQSRRMLQALRTAGVPCELVTVPDGTHGTRGWDELRPAWKEDILAWLTRRLGARGVR